MIALEPNFNCATLIVIHLCATYLRHCFFAAEVKAMEICATLELICATHIGGPKRLIIWADCLADFEVKVLDRGIILTAKSTYSSVPMDIK